MPSTVAIIGAGRTGAGWAARFLLHGWTVRVFDPDPATPERVAAVLARARAALPGLAEGSLPDEGALSYPGFISETVAGADWVQDSTPDRLELKHTLYHLLQEHMDTGAVLGSSTGVFMPSELQAVSNRPDQIVVAHPLDPVYLMPLVELVGSDRNGAAVMARAEEVLARAGLTPLKLRGEMPAHLANRLREAAWREAISLIRDGIATTGEVDAVLRLGLGPSWTGAGLFGAERLAAGEEGFAARLDRDAPTLSAPFGRLTHVPPMDPPLMRRIVEQIEETSANGGEEGRDRDLVGILRASGPRPGRPAPSSAPLNFSNVDELSRPLPVLARSIPLDWTDEAGQTLPARFADLAAEASVRLLELLGWDEDGCALVPVETHLTRHASLGAAAPVRILSRVLAVGLGRLHVWHDIQSRGVCVATAEEVLRHAPYGADEDLPLPAAFRDRALRIVQAQANLPAVEGARRVAPLPEVACPSASGAFGPRQG